MHGFDLDQLKTLVAAVDAGSLTAAVQLRFRSQSALSEQLNKLEEAAGERLLVRSKSGVTPTAAGQRLVAHAREILALSDAAWRDMHDVPLAGEVHIGISDYFRPSQLAQLLARIALHYPGLRMRTQIDKSDNIAAAHGSGSLDLAIIMRASGSEYPFASEARTLRTERLLWATSRDKPVAVKDTVVELALLSETCSLHRLVRSKLDACLTSSLTWPQAWQDCRPQSWRASASRVSMSQRSSRPIWWRSPVSRFRHCPPQIWSCCR